MDREHWSSKLSFFFAAMGSAVGLGVLWKFPYVVGENGGGFFLMAYVLCLLLIGVPLFFAEVTMGKLSQSAVVGTFRSLGGGAIWRLSGLFAVLIAFLITSFYNVIGGWGLSYVLMSLLGVFHSGGASHVTYIFRELQYSSDINIFWHGLFTLLNTVIVFFGLRRGIEYSTQFMMQGLFIIIFALAIYASRLPGYSDALLFFFYPRWEDFRVSSILEALGLALFTLSVGQGVMFGYGSYLGKDSKILGVIVAITIGILSIAMLASIVVFSVVFTFGYAPSLGSGLIFQTLPYLFSQLFGGEVISLAFFTLFTFAAITSSVPFLDVITSTLVEEVGWKRKKAIIIASIAIFLIGLPSAASGSGDIFGEWQRIYGMNFLDTLNFITSSWFIPLQALSTSIFVGWVWPKHSSYPSNTTILWRVWAFSMKWVVPVLVFFIIIEKGELINF